MRLTKLRLAFLTDNEWSHKSAAICRNVDAVNLTVVIDGDKLLDATALPQQAHISHELYRLLVDTNRLTVQEYQDVLR